jgi:polyhydroxybutyrate depolymerase
VTTAARDWAAQDHCSTPATTSTSTDVVLDTYSHCANGAQVELYEIIGEGHEWPGGPTLPSSITDLLGPQSNAVDANALIWSFFSAHRLG